MFFGKIYKDSDKRALKQVGIKNNQHLVVQLLDVPEVLDDNQFVVLVCKRDVENRVYAEKKEHIFTFPK